MTTPQTRPYRRRGKRKDDMPACIADCGKVRKAQLRRCDTPSLPYFNLLSGIPALTTAIGGNPWRVAFSRVVNPATAVSHLDVYWHVAWDDCTIVVAMSRHGLRLLFESCGCECPYAALPEEVALAVGQTALDDASNALSQRGLSPLRLENIHAGPENHDGAYEISLDAACDNGNGKLHGVLYADITGLTRITCALAAAAMKRYPVDRWAGLPVSVTLELGWSSLPLSDIRTLRRGDVVVADHCWSDKHGRSIAIRISDRFIIRGEIAADGTVIATSGIMNMPIEESNLTDADSAGSLDASPDADIRAKTDADIGTERASDHEMQIEGFDSIPVRMSFDLGERILNLGELASLQSGHVFDLALPAAQAVTLRVNGARVGEGELVEIEGRIGVAITRIAAPGQT
jgi:type III secretion protein Q